MTYNVFDGTLNLAQSVNPHVVDATVTASSMHETGKTASLSYVCLSSNVKSLKRRHTSVIMSTGCTSTSSMPSCCHISCGFAFTVLTYMTWFVQCIYYLHDGYCFLFSVFCCCYVSPCVCLCLSVLQKSAARFFAITFTNVH